MKQADVQRAARRALRDIALPGVRIRFVAATEDAGVFRVGLWTGDIGPNLTVDLSEVESLSQAVEVVEDSIRRAIDADS